MLLKDSHIHQGRAESKRLTADVLFEYALSGIFQRVLSLDHKQIVLIGLQYDLEKPSVAKIKREDSAESFDMLRQ
jgi:hypothetical protein